MRRAAIAVTVLTTVVGSGVTIAQASPLSPGARSAATGSSHTGSSHAGSSTTASPRPSWLRTHGFTPASAATSAARNTSLGAATTTGKVDPAVAKLKPAANGTVHVQVDGPTGAVASQVQLAGGRVLSSANGASSVVVPASKVAALAATSAVTSISAGERPVETASGPSQGVVSSGADQWQTAGDTGSGVKVAVVDGGFGDNQTQYNNEVTAGHLGAGTTVINKGCLDQNNVSSPYVDPHGLAVAEIVQQEAPGAQLFLYCVNMPSDVALAESDIEANGIKIVTSSLAWPNDSRGDGVSPAAGSVSATVEHARKNGILWIESAGNDVPFHIGGTMVDSNHDGFLDIGNADANTYPFESNFYYVAPDAGVPTGADFFFKWDQWPGNTSRVQLQAYGLQCHNNFGTGGNDDCQGVWMSPPGVPTITATHTSGAPTLHLDTGNFANTSPYSQVWEIAVAASGYPRVHYDMTGFGDMQFASDLSCPTADSNNHCIWAPGAVQGSIESPADSPYVLAVGAACVQTITDPSNGSVICAQNSLEYFSSQGPVVDGRPKPDITGWDDVNTFVTDYPNGFSGTSAAAPHVAGAAALVAAANPMMDASQIQTFLEQRASSGAPSNPPNNQMGHGLLTLGPTPTATPVAAPVPAGYTAVTPQRILDTRPTALGAGATRVVALPGTVPSDATAVAINLTGVGASVATNLRVYPGPTLPGTSNLNLDTTDRTEAVFAIVAVNHVGNTITVRNQSGQVNALIDLLGYFDAAGTGKYSTVTPTRAYDSRLSHGGAGPFGAGTTRTVQTVPSGVPSGAVAAVVNVTSVNSAGSGDLRLSASCAAVTSTLNYNTRTRANMAFAPLANDGSFCVTADGSTTDVLVDVVGYISSTGTAGYVALPSPVRIMDTRSGNQAPVGVVGSTQERTLFGAGIFGVPYVATGTSGVFVGVTGVSPTAGTDLEVFPGTVRPSPPTSTLNLAPGEVVPNAAVAGLNSSQFSVYNSSGAIHIIVDLFGYFA